MISKTLSLNFDKLVCVQYI